MVSLFYSSVLCRISILIGTQFCKFQIRPSDLIFGADKFVDLDLLPDVLLKFLQVFRLKLTLCLCTVQYSYRDTHVL